MLIDDMRAAEAEPILRRVLEGTVSLHGADHPETWPTRTNLVDALRRQRRLGEAIDMQRELLAAQQRLLPEDHGAVLFSMNNVAVLLAEAGRRDEAIEVLRRRIELRPDDSTSLLARHNLAMMLMNAGHLEEAEALERIVLERRRQLPSPRLDEVSGACLMLGCILAQLERYDEADLLMVEARTLAEESFGAGHPRVIRCRFERGKVLRALRRFDEAVLEFESVDASRADAPKWLIDALPGEFVALYEAWERPDDAARWRSIADAASR
jgi:tetratricopeptide (TPR) repeat protein